MDETIRDLERRLLAAKNRAGEAPYVVVRCRNAGVHAGLLEYEGPELGRVQLRESRRLWQWVGAKTLSEVATVGVNSASCRFGVKINVILLDAIEIIYATPAGRAAIESAPIWQ